MHMTLYSIVVFLHVVAMLGVFVALGTEWLLLSNIWFATDAAGARALIRASARLPVVGLSSCVFVLLTGIYLSTEAKAWSMPWIQVSLGAIVVMGFLGGISGRRMRAMRKTAASECHASLDTYRRSAADAVLQIAIRVRFATGLAIVLLMVLRCDMTASLSVMGAAFASGVLWGAPIRQCRFIERTTT